MQPIATEFLRQLSNRLKLGDNAKPVFRVEVDRMVFIPGRTEQLSWMVEEYADIRSVSKQYMNQVDDGTGGQSYVARTVNNSAGIVFPAQGYSLANVTSEFGNRHLAGRSSEMHKGIDLGVPYGTPILAALDGYVTAINLNPGASTGLCVEIQHNKGIKTRYMHASSITVTAVGQQVAAGQEIAKVGSTGDSTGNHLHFEIWEGSNNGNGGNPTNPRDWLNGSRALVLASNNAGEGSIDDGLITGTAGERVVHEEFVSREWYANAKYEIDANLLGYALINTVGPNEVMALDIQFSTETNGTLPITTGFKINVFLTKAGFMDIGYVTNFLPDVNEFRVYVNERLVRRVTTFTGNWMRNEVVNTYVPDGLSEIRFEVIWGGTRSGSFAFDSINIYELNAGGTGSESRTIQRFSKQDTALYNQSQRIADNVFNRKEERVDLQVGSFAYMDTLVLDNLVSVEIDNQLEMAAGEAKVTITNPNGGYSPDYSPYLFPEIGRLSPWSFFANGMQIGVLSENTPVRIYAGYGPHMQRIFTGLIDKVDMNGEASLVFTCRDMYKRILEKVIVHEKMYPSAEGDSSDGPRKQWLKSAIVQDLVSEAGLFGWRSVNDDLYYPDAVVEETYLIEINRKEGTYIAAVENKEGEFVEKDYADAVLTPQGWLNPFVESYGKKFTAYQYKVADAINEIIQDTGMRTYCDRYGTYRLEKVDMNKPIVATLTEHENLISITKTMDWSRGRSHLVIVDGDGNRSDFVDLEIINELKGEIRTAVVVVEWAKSFEQKRQVAQSLFFDMKRSCRTLQVGIPMNPALDVLDRVWVIDRMTTTRSVYTIKGIRTTYSEEGAIQVIDLTWAMDGVMV
ncbi:MAG: peptidoglycan DD-metalloendopeptidase family protein [Cohnella sp.]|nr:peptidoglycan DD-metalloendopeptidase family protein [Cohnella sp.]